MIINEETKHSIVGGILIFVFCLFIGAAVTTGFYKARYDKSQYELGQVRTELESTHNRERELEESFTAIRTVTGEAVGYVSREHDLLLESGNTIQEIKLQVESLERYCDSLELYIYSIRGYTLDKGELNGNKE